MTPCATPNCQGRGVPWCRRCQRRLAAREAAIRARHLGALRAVATAWTPVRHLPRPGRRIEIRNQRPSAPAPPQAVRRAVDALLADPARLREPGARKLVAALRAAPTWGTVQEILDGRS